MKKTVLGTSIVAALALLSACSSVDTNKSAAPVKGGDIGRSALAANDGWASVGGGVDGGAKAKPENVYTVSNRAELVKALAAGGTAPKIIYVKGSINLSVDDNNKELFEKDYAAPGYDFNAYVKTYAPAVWNTKLAANKRPERKLSGPLEEAREKSSENQKKRIVIDVTSNTTIVGLGADAKIVKGNLMIGNGTENVIIRNITFEDAFDYFAGWDPGDSWNADKSYPGCQEAFVDAKTGPQQCPGGRWNSEYDNISINGGKRVWIDHCTFTDGDRDDKKFPSVFPFPHNQIEQKVQHHDGLIDITNSADLVTITYNHFQKHDKTSLIGGSDSLTSDAGKLNVTYYGNYFENSGQRLPRVRFGKVHSYNNLIVGDAAGYDPKLSGLAAHEKALKESGAVPIYRGAFGIGKDSLIYSENNAFEIKNGGASIAGVIQGGTKFFDAGSIVNGQAADLVAAINSVDPKRQVSADLGWKPTLYGGKTPIPAKDVPAHVRANAGAGKL
ncbi:PbsX family transcriptional regulator [Uliginosibacterium sp. H3]|uniref:PbsX family transcriptional regulator n=1 Tax=Uliginosibacterium silvisoli TaxID=3114758 RepID=A0ABU6KA28_9RHOO|nr:PbsX family transcriptional regulator [Uliginosibacterium sp. H3]